METHSKYLDELLKKGHKVLESELTIDDFNFDNFSILNSYIIYKAIINEHQKNTLIHFPDKETKTEFYIPVIIALSLEIFLENYVNYDYNRSQKESLYGNFFSYLYNIHDNTVPVYFGEKSIIITDKLYENTLKTFSSNLFYLSRKEILKKVHKETVDSSFKPIINKIFNNKDEYFNYCSEILGNCYRSYKLELDSSICYDIYQAFPFCYITKTGKINYNIHNYPMIYIVNNYETARKYVLDKEIKIKNVVFIGANKYKSDLIHISEDLNNQRISKCLFIGSNDVEEYAIPNLCKWKWTLHELDYFSYIESIPILTLEIDNEVFSQLLDMFFKEIEKVEKEYLLDLSEIYKFGKYILHFSIPTKTSNQINELEYVYSNFKKEAYEIIESAFQEIDEYDFEEYWDKIFVSYTNLIEYQKNNSSKFDQIKRQINSIDYLVVPKALKSTWESECNQYYVKNIISFNEYKALNVKKKTIVFLGFFGYDHLKAIIHTPNKIHLSLYPEENDYYNKCLNRLKNETANELKSNDRELLSGIKFKQAASAENASEVLDRIFEKNSEINFNTEYQINYSTNIIYELAFEEDDEILKLDSNKTILLKTNKQEINEIIRNLKPGNQIRIYDNATKEVIYDIALNSDEKGIFEEIELYSKLWKLALLEYSFKFDSISSLLHHLVENGLTIKSENTIENWINPSNKIKFPQTYNNLLVLKNTIKSDTFDKRFKGIVKNRKSFNGIMIALGRDLSDEISHYILHKEKGENILKLSDTQLENIINQNAPLKTIKRIEVTDDE